MMRHVLYIAMVMMHETAAQDIYEYTTETASPGSTMPSASAAPSRVYVANGGTINIHSGGSLEIGAQGSMGDGAAMLPAPITAATATVYSVSGGSFSDPYFTIKDEDGNVVVPSFAKGRSYIFKADASAGGVSTSHPFFIGECPATGCAPWSDENAAKMVANGQDITGTDGMISFMVPDDFSGDICYYCVMHPSPMMKCFSV